MFTDPLLMYLWLILCFVGLDSFLTFGLWKSIDALICLS